MKILCKKILRVKKKNEDLNIGNNFCLICFLGGLLGFNR